MDNPNPEWLIENYPTKYDCDKDFRCGAILECGNYIAKQIIDFLEECKKEEKDLLLKDISAKLPYKTK